MPTVKGYRQLGEQSGSIELGEKKVVSRYSLEYIVIADNASQGAITIRATAGLPKIGLSTYAYHGESDPLAICKRKTARRDSKQPLVWTVRCEFDDDPRSQSEENEDSTGSAVDRNPIISWDSEYGEEVLHRDYSDPRKPILTPIGHGFDPPLVKRVIYPVLTIERFQASFTPAIILANEDHVNENAFFGAAPGHALMAKISAKQVVEDGTRLWSVAFRIRFAVHEDGFTEKPLNQDTHYFDFTTSTINPILTPFIKGNVPYIGNLKLNGGAADPGERTFGGADGLGFKPYPKADFDLLGLE